LIPFCRQTGLTEDASYLILAEVGPPPEFLSLVSLLNKYLNPPFPQGSSDVRRRNLAYRQAGLMKDWSYWQA